MDSKPQLQQFLANYVTNGTNLLFPPECLICRAPQQVGGKICYECFRQLEFVDEEVCYACGLPHHGSEPYCIDCAEDPPLWDRLVATFWYDDMSRRIVFALKNGQVIAVMNFIAAQMAGRIAEGGDVPDMLIPIPSHVLRMLSRGYNQSFEIARALSRVFDLPLEGRVLRKKKHTKKQMGRDFEARFQNQIDVFGLDSRRGAQIVGKHIGLVDDVFTSGATCEAATRVLLEGGAAKVSVFVFARAGISA